jgi:hypothetical protein
MTEKRDPDVPVDKSGPASDTTGFSRRDLIRGFSVAAPTILTLSSTSLHAAMASAVVISPRNAAEQDGKFYCLDEKSTAGYANSPPYAPGSLVKDSTRAPMVTRYPDRNYVLPKLDSTTGQLTCGGGTTGISELDMCRGSTSNPTGLYCYQATGWNQVNVPKGITVSIAAMTSFGVTLGNIRDV